MLIFKGLGWFWRCLGSAKRLWMSLFVVFVWCVAKQTVAFRTKTHQRGHPLWANGQDPWSIQGLLAAWVQTWYPYDILGFRGIKDQLCKSGQSMCSVLADALSWMHIITTVVVVRTQFLPCGLNFETPVILPWPPFETSDVCVCISMLLQIASCSHALLLLLNHMYLNQKRYYMPLSLTVTRPKARRWWCFEKQSQCCEDL